MQQLFLPLALALCIAGCASPYSVKIPRERIPPAPSIEERERITREWLTEHLKDPESMRLGRGVDPVPAFTCGGNPPFILDLHETGWIWGRDVNAKNSFGGYTGSKLYFFYLGESGRVIAWTGERGIVPAREYPLAVRPEQIQDETERSPPRAASTDSSGPTSPE